MKKILTSAALLLTIPAALVGCGADRGNTSTDNGHFEQHDYGNNADGRDDRDDHRDDNRDDNPIEDRVHDGIDGVESAAEDIVSGAGDAANDIVDGVDGDYENSDNFGDSTSIVPEDNTENFTDNAR